MYIYLLVSLIIVLEMMGINMVGVQFPINFDIYLVQIVENIKILKDGLIQLIIKISYNVLYGFSVCQIQLNKIKNIIEPYKKKAIEYLKDNNIILDVKLQYLNLIDKNGNISTTFIISDKLYGLELLESIFDIGTVSGAIFYDKNVETGCVNKIYMEKCPTIVDKKLDYKLSKINFIMVELEHNDEKYKIELKNDEHNYYIVNNSLNQNFFKYYLKNVLKARINEDNFDYKVTIIDHNVNFVTLLPHQHIVIDELDYTIYPLESHNNNSETENTYTKQDIIIDEQSTSSDSDKSDDFIKLDASLTS